MQQAAALVTILESYLENSKYNSLASLTVSIICKIVKYFFWPSFLSAVIVRFHAWIEKKYAVFQIQNLAAQIQHRK